MGLTEVERLFSNTNARGEITRTTPASFKSGVGNHEKTAD